jgi:hypothetical protein
MWVAADHQGRRRGGHQASSSRGEERAEASGAAHRQWA